MFRSHGTDCAREIWEFGRPGEPVYDAIAAQIKFRYRLLPYLYSTAWQVTSNGGSYMRPLFADFASDRRTWQEPHEFLFGKSILAAPIVQSQYTPEAIDRSKPENGQLDAQGLDGWSASSTATTDEGFPVVDFSGTKLTTKYLPKCAPGWYDFWTGKLYSGGQDVTLETRFDRVPMFVRGGSIVPLGPEMQYVGEKSWSELELRVYPGADASFTLYEDEGDSYNYEKGKYTTITMRWDDRSRRLTIGQRQGDYVGMADKRLFNITLPDGTVHSVNYDGAEVTIKL